MSAMQLPHSGGRWWWMPNARTKKKKEKWSEGKVRPLRWEAVSYTHLDVYKRQDLNRYFSSSFHMIEWLDFFFFFFFISLYSSYSLHLRVIHGIYQVQYSMQYFYLIFILCFFGSSRASLSILYSYTFVDIVVPELFAFF